MIKKKGRPFGYKHKESSKIKMSISRMGNKNGIGNKNALGLHFTRSKETKKRMSLAQLGRKASEEAKKNMSLSKLGNKNSLGHKHTKESKLKMSLSRRLDKHPNWKGDEVGNQGLHGWLRVHFGRAYKCENPNCKYPRKTKRGILMIKPLAFHWANISGKYKRDRNDFMMLCSSCHKLFDNIKNKNDKFLFITKNNLH